MHLVGDLSTSRLLCFLKETSSLKAKEHLIEENAVIIQILVQSQAVSVSDKTGFAYHLYLLSNFPRAAILDYMTSYGCQYAMLPHNSGNHMTSQNPKWQGTRNLMRKSAIILTQFLLLLNVIFTLSSKILDLLITTNNSKPACCKS